ncbi:hypothetical protein MLD38_022466 [Melastoma candidum]|uniref:Uncharacterized protein n=1 Tax=Melastoma candidum TaxID=119954 RepID=A0ACB9QMC0_9MYRT|nr:hypothetical protein MLD38_022466 [Melastoma candidum]
MESEESEFVERDPSGRYGRYDEILGEGAFKVVYKAFDEILGIEVAWNQVSIDHFPDCPANLRRLFSEVDLLKSVKHGNIIKFLHSWVDEEKINIITELFTSGNLRQYRKKHKRVELKAIKNWGQQILRGIEYLHSHDPPIIHRDLKCDNIFVNGYDGRVKIGDLGLATVMQQPCARSVIGTPEFMAPELYDEEYNELVDIYSFGMCVLEMVTCECPYNECRNAAQIFKKVTSGIKPASLEKVKDPQVKEFIEKCLVPADIRPSASDLLKDVFFVNSEDSRIPKSVPYESSFLNIQVTRQSDLELKKSTRLSNFRILGEKKDEGTVELNLIIASACGVDSRNVRFLFFLNSDTVASVTMEMVEQLGLCFEDANAVAELMQSLIEKIVPGWNSLLKDREAGNQCSIDLLGIVMDDVDEGNSSGCDLMLPIRVT